MNTHLGDAPDETKNTENALAEASEEASPPKKTRGTMIILEDSDHSRNVLQFFLEKNEFAVLAYANGQDAVADLEAKDVREAKVIFTDIMMPHMTGLEFVQHLQKTNRMADVPIVVVSAMTDRDNIVNAKKLGVKGYLLKPITIKKVVELLKKLFPDDIFIEPSPNAKRR
jgi:CheY-like chemotaxis protein